MLFNTIAATVLGLATFASAAPRARPDTGIAERGLVWSPRSLKGAVDKRGRGHKNEEIIDTTIVVLDEQSRNKETELVVIVQEKIKINDGSRDENRKHKDNIRKNHYRNKNNNENTVIVVVTEIVDVRDSNNRNSRYVTRKIKADNKKNQDVTVIINEIVALTVDSNDSNQYSSTIGNSASASVSAGAAIQTVDSSAPYLASNQSVLIPSGVPPPAFVEVDLDPARILEKDQIDVIVETISE